MFSKLAAEIREYIKLSKLRVEGKPIDKSELKDGLKVEREHDMLTHRNTAQEAQIALDHLKEVPDYYTKLKKYVESDKA